MIIFFIVIQHNDDKLKPRKQKENQIALYYVNQLKNFFIKDKQYWFQSTQNILINLISKYLDEEFANEKNALNNIGITHLINCSPEECKNQYKQDKKYIDIKLSYGTDKNVILDVIDTIIEFISDVISQKGQKVLIYSKEGISRGPTIALAYLIFKNENISLKAALRHLKSVYPKAEPNIDFEIQLQEFQQEQQNSLLRVNSEERIQALNSRTHQKRNSLKLFMESNLHSGENNNKDLEVQLNKLSLQSQQSFNLQIQQIQQKLQQDESNEYDYSQNKNDIGLIDDNLIIDDDDNEKQKNEENKQKQQFVQQQQQQLSSSSQQLIQDSPFLMKSLSLQQKSSLMKSGSLSKDQIMQLKNMKSLIEQHKQQNQKLNQ
ncbi:hypothetical protein PPERSA_09806 [Pseudocohnilembus persalinus]|uniref:protein-tyrosine-phosphatase n=1 Tax=Pseudocohnilembus persalinus TaxID=266149 RepID=A0A0V0QTT3_PSEPJ|nr:hypothetical protein PPERSA_09806 [Pseudocohnilembus persalinus]|eukprot:KRX05666.1 hypothetical protein PPERSA_09806 [Pseudocohnilembus persalinus]